MAMNGYLKHIDELRVDEINGVDIAELEAGDWVVLNKDKLAGVVLTDPVSRPGATSTGALSVSISFTDEIFIGTSTDALDAFEEVYLADGKLYGKKLTNDDDTKANALVGYSLYSKDAGAGPVHVLPLR